MSALSPRERMCIHPLSVHNNYGFDFMILPRATCIRWHIKIKVDF